jgi:hypothetical protein
MSEGVAEISSPGIPTIRSAKASPEYPAVVAWSRIDLEGPVLAKNTRLINAKTDIILETVIEDAIIFLHLVTKVPVT